MDFLNLDGQWKCENNTIEITSKGDKSDHRSKIFLEITTNVDDKNERASIYGIDRYTRALRIGITLDSIILKYGQNDQGEYLDVLLDYSIENDISRISRFYKQ